MSELINIVDKRGVEEALMDYNLGNGMFAAVFVLIGKDKIRKITNCDFGLFPAESTVDEEGNISLGGGTYV